MKDELHLHKALKYAADMQQLEKQGYRMININDIIGNLEDKALEHEIAGYQFGTDELYDRAKEEYFKCDGVNEAIKIIKVGVEHG